MPDLVRRFATNLLWVFAAIWAVAFLSYAITSLFWGRIPPRIAATGSAALVIAAHLTYQQSLEES